MVRAHRKVLGVVKVVVGVVGRREAHLVVAAHLVVVRRHRGHALGRDS